MLKLSKRMVRSSFIDNISISAEHKWMPLPLGWPISGAENVRISTDDPDDPGKPPGSTVVFATSINLPFPRKQLFSFFRDKKCRNELKMAARRNTRHTRILSTGADAYLKNVNSSAKFKATTSDHEVQRVLNLIKVCGASSSGSPKIEAYSDSGLNLWVDLKINSTPKDDLDHGDFPQPTTLRQRSPPQYGLDLSDLPQHTVTPQCSSMQYDLEDRVLPPPTASSQGSTPKYDFDLNELPQPTTFTC